MSQRQPLSDKFARYLAHWKALRPANQVPALADFLDNPIPTMQPWIAIFDVNATLTLRLHGTALVNFFGTDFTGTPSDKVFSPEGFAEQRRIHMQIADLLCGCILVSSGETSSGRLAELVSFGLPLRRRGGISVAWLVEPAVVLSRGEAGSPVTGVVSEDWIDLGHGIPR